MVESEQVIRRLLASPAWRRRIKSLLLSDRRHESLRDLLSQHIAPSVPVHVAPEPLLEDIAGYRHHGGALAAVYRPDELSLDRALSPLRASDDPCLILLAEGMTNRDNVGTLFRNAAAFGVDAIVLRDDCADPLFRKAVRVSMGHVFHVPWAESRDWPGDLARLRDEWRITLFGAESMRSALPLHEIPRTARAGFIFGTQKNGLTDESIHACTDIYEIPMAASVPSINVSVASAVFLYEWRRARDVPEVRSGGVHRLLSSAE